MVFMVSCFIDSFAYITGSILKGPKLCPKISPKKTWTGAVGGLFGGMTGALLALMLLVREGSNLQAFLTHRIGDTVAVQLVFVAVGLVGAVITQVGDIYASYFKRKTGIKDFGTYLPGHGGAMDRLDGISFNAVFMFFTFILIAFA